LSITLRRKLQAYNGKKKKKKLLFTRRRRGGRQTSAVYKRCRAVRAVLAGTHFGKKKGGSNNPEKAGLGDISRNEGGGKRSWGLKVQIIRTRR